MTSRRPTARSSPPPGTPPVRTRLLDSAVDVIRRKGYHATSVDDLCTAAGVTKGAFFHHFKSKEDLAVTAVQYWHDNANALFTAAPYQTKGDARARILGYLDYRIALIAGRPEEFSCLPGTMAQEVHQSSEAIRAACDACISGHAATLERDIAAALPAQAAARGITAESVALHTQTVLQGAFLMAKAKLDPAVAIDSIRHLRRYFEFLFDPQCHKEM